jgi:hypothetical protein
MNTSITAEAPPDPVACHGCGRGGTAILRDIARGHAMCPACEGWRSFVLGAAAGAAALALLLAVASLSWQLLACLTR